MENKIKRCFLLGLGVLTSLSLISCNRNDSSSNISVIDSSVYKVAFKLKKHL